MTSDLEPSGKTAIPWSDRERLVYLVALLETADIKFNYVTSPRPAGRTPLACQRMVERLKGTFKVDLDALKAGNPINYNGDDEGNPLRTPSKRRKPATNEDGTPKTPVKRKPATNEDGTPKTPKRKGAPTNEGGTPKKARGKNLSEATVKDEPEADMDVKEEDDFFDFV